MSKAPPDLVCIDKTKLNESFADFQFYMENYQSHHHAPTLTYPPPLHPRPNRRFGEIEIPKVVVN